MPGIGSVLGISPERRRLHKFFYPEESHTNQGLSSGSIVFNSLL